MKARFFVTLFSCFLALLKKSYSVEVYEKMASAELEAQAQDLGKMIKCPSCQGQSIEDSNAEMASALRRLVRDRLDAGETVEEVLSFLKNFYGEAILFDPVWSSDTYFLWLGPFIFLGLLFSLWLFKAKRPL